MLTIITGKAGAGKTGKIIENIKEAVNAKKGGNYLLVPELFSYEAQREMCSLCGNSVSLYATVTTFTDLFRSVCSELGGNNVPYLDDAGRLLCMSLALRELQSSDALKHFKSTASKIEVASMMVNALDEMKQSALTSTDLLDASEHLGGALSEKLCDLASVSRVYEDILSDSNADPSDQLKVLAEKIPYSHFSSADTFYIDGFIGFTQSEYNVLTALLQKGVNMVVCLTLDIADDKNEYFAVASSTAHRLKTMAESLGINHISRRYTNVSEKKNVDREYFSCSGILQECEFAALKVKQLIESDNCRYRDIAIAVRGFDEYRPVLESTFEKFSIPLFTAKKETISSKPLPVFIQYAYEVCLNGFSADDVISILGTGITELGQEQCDELSGYLHTWDLKEGHWRQSKPWYQNPRGYIEDYSDEDNEILSKVNTYRKIIGGPLIKFADSIHQSNTVHEHVLSLYTFLDEMNVCKNIPDEDVQIWDVCIGALEQINAILSDKIMEADEFCRLFTIMLSKYSVGSIPDSVDSVSAGDFDRMRRRHIKHLIVLGASSDRIPMPMDSKGLFSSDELNILSNINLEFGGNCSENLFREFSLIYNCFSLPSDKLIFAFSGDPAFLIKYDENHKPIDFKEEVYRPLRPTMVPYFDRGRLSEESVNSLYGSNLYISATKADCYHKCKYSYFMKYGLRANPYETAAFDAPAYGTFVHYVLENVAREVSLSGGFGNVDDGQIKDLVQRYIDEYVKDELNNFAEKSERFIYLFNRTRDDVYNIILDTASELRHSKFTPYEFELDFSKDKRFAPIKINGGKDLVKMSGIADRVDKWESGGKSFVRVVDYKTGKKEFNLSEINQGIGMQMLMYLYTLAASEENMVPAGVMYVPAHDKYVSLNSSSSDDAEKKRGKEKRRSGIYLDAYGVPSAWEDEDSDVYIPQKGETSFEQFNLLSNHVLNKLSEMAQGVHEGQIDADPCVYGSKLDACRYCDFKGSCGFSDGQNGEQKRKIKTISNDDFWAELGGDLSE